jgi:hypothetical protein
MGNSDVLGGRDLECFSAIRERGAIQLVNGGILYQGKGVCGLCCGDNRSERLQDLCGFHDRLQTGHTETPKSFFFTCAAGPLALAPDFPVSEILAQGFDACLYTAIKNMLVIGDYATFVHHGHYPCLGVEHVFGSKQLFRVMELSFAAKGRSKTMFPDTTVAYLCQFDRGEPEGKRSYFLSRPHWQEAYDDLQRYFGPTSPVTYSVSSQA